MTEKEYEKNKTQNEIQKIASAPPRKRKSLLTPAERSVVFGFVYAGLVAILTLMMDWIPVPNKDSTLWMIMAGFYILLVGASILLEEFLFKRMEIRRTLFYAAAQLAILIGIIVLAVIGIRTSGDEYYNSKELSYAMAFVFSETVLLLYHLFRMAVLGILHSKRDGKTTKAGRPGKQAAARKK